MSFRLLLYVTSTDCRPVLPMFLKIRRRLFRKILPLALLAYAALFLILWWITVTDSHIWQNITMLNFTNGTLQKVLQSSLSTTDDVNSGLISVLPWNYWDNFQLPIGMKPKKINILMWTKYYNNMDLTDHITMESPIPEWCVVSFDRQKLPESQALVFHVTGRDLNIKDLPPRNQSQLWVYYTIEPPIYMARESGPLNGLFNRTMTYRLDSDYPCPYGFARKLKDPPSSLPPTFLQAQERKRGLVAWMVSHCSTTSHRELLVKKLQKFISVDVYGACGTFFCDPRDEEGCYRKLGEQYKFYLSFENSLCKDYITEKFSNALRYNMVPVVYGGGDYSSILPFPNSFIQVKDFKNMKHLSEYLHYLNNNQTAYLEYFEWKKVYEIEIRQGFGGFRRMCYALQFGDQRNNKVYHNIKRWYVDKGNCTSPIISRRIVRHKISD